MTSVGDLFEGVNFGSMFSGGLTITFWIVIACFFAAIAFFIWWIFSFKITVIIRETVSKSFYYKPGKETVFSDANYRPPKQHGLPLLGSKKEGKVARFMASVKSVFSEIEPEHEDLPKINANEEGKKIRIIPTIIGVHKAKITSKRGVKRLQLMFPYQRFKLPEQIFHSLTKKGKKCIELVKISEHLYMPSVFTDERHGINKMIFDEGYVDWLVRDIESDVQKYNRQGFWDQYGQQIMNIGTLVICMIIIIVTLKYSKDIVETAKPMAQALAESAKEFANVIKTQNL